MPSDTTEIKEKIIQFIKQKGPSLPVHIAKEINTSTLFTSAFLSELLSEKLLRASHMRVGTSPVYFIPEDEAKLENFSKFLKSKEKESFELLKKEKFLKDAEQQPAIRVALREIKDFAIPFKDNEEIIWRYMTSPESEFLNPKNVEEEKINTQKIDVSSTDIRNIQQENKQENVEKEIKKEFEKSEETKKIRKAKRIKKAKTEKQNPKFFEKIKDFSKERNIEILDMIDFRKGEIILKIKEKEKEMVLIAFDKKKISEGEIIKAYKKANELGLDYIILSKSETSKKINELIKAIKKLHSIENLESQNLKTDFRTI